MATDIPKLQPSADVSFVELQLCLPLRVSGPLKEQLSSQESWRPIKDLLKRPNTKGRTIHAEYAELVYFHPIIQERLLGRRGIGASKHGVVINAWEREDLQEITFWLPIGYDADDKKRPVQKVTFDVRGVMLHEFPLDVSSPATESPQSEALGDEFGNIVLFTLALRADVQSISNRYYDAKMGLDGLTFGKKTGLDVSGVLNILDCVRRVYPCYVDKATNQGGRIALAVETEDHGRLALPFGDDAINQALDAENPKIPLLDWVKKLLHPITLGPQEKAALILDDRMQQMAYVSMPDTRLLTEAELIRFAWADGPTSNREGLPYNPAFLSNWQDEVSYGRWAHYGTHYFCTGFNWVLLAPTTEFNDDSNGSVLGSFRGAYFQLYLLINFYKAALHTLSEQLSETFDRQTDDPDHRFQLAMSNYQRALNFSQRYWFESPTPQLQGMELFERHRKQSGVDALYQRVMREAQTISDYLQIEAQRNERIAQDHNRRSQDRLNRSISRLTIGQFALAALALAGSALTVGSIATYQVLGMLWLLGMSYPSYWFLKALVAWIHPDEAKVALPSDDPKKSSINGRVLLLICVMGCLLLGYFYNLKRYVVDKSATHAISSKMASFSTVNPPK